MTAPRKSSDLLAETAMRLPVIAPGMSNVSPSIHDHGDPKADRIAKKIRGTVPNKRYHLNFQRAPTRNETLHKTSNAPVAIRNRIQGCIEVAQSDCSVKSIPMRRVSLVLERVYGEHQATASMILSRNATDNMA